MTPFVKLKEELDLNSKEELIAHILWLYRYIEEIKKLLRNKSRDTWWELRKQL